MGAALMAALSNPKQFASLPQSFVASIVNDQGLIFGRKSDRIRPFDQQSVFRRARSSRSPPSSRQGDRDFIKLRPFARISATLSLGNPQHRRTGSALRPRAASSPTTSERYAPPPQRRSPPIASPERYRCSGRAGAQKADDSL